MKRLLSTIYMCFSYFNLIMAFLSLTIWQVTWVFILISCWTNLNPYDSPPLINEPLIFKIPYTLFAILTIGNLIHMMLHESFSKLESVDWLHIDYRCDRITSEELNNKKRKLWKLYLLCKLDEYGRLKDKYR